MPFRFSERSRHYHKGTIARGHSIILFQISAIINTPQSRFADPIWGAHHLLKIGNSHRRP
jgi:hypothetical protein